MKVTLITPKKTLTLEADKGENLLSVLRGQKMLIHADYGGRGICNKCFAAEIKIIEPDNTCFYQAFIKI